MVFERLHVDERVVGECVRAVDHVERLPKSSTRAHRSAEMYARRERVINKKFIERSCVRSGHKFVGACRNAVVVTALLSACGGAVKGKPTSGARPSGASSNPTTPATEGVGENVHHLDPIRIRVVGKNDKGEPELIAFDARGLLDEGNEALSSGQLSVALARYRALIQEFPRSELVTPALYNVGLVFERMRKFDQAIKAYRKVIAHDAKSRDAVDGHVRIGAVLGQKRRFAEAAKEFERMLDRTDLRPNDRVEGMARLGWVLLEQKLYARAEAVLKEARDYYRRTSSSVDFDTNYFGAMAGYYLGQIPHRQAMAVPLRVVAGHKQLERDIDQKVGLLLTAYDRYHETVKVYNAYWSTAAGYQMSQMYKEFWDAIVLAALPPHLTPAQAKRYTAELHRRGMMFLKKALEGHGQNIELAKAFKTTTEWSEASRVRANEITAILARETSGEFVKPVPDATGLTGQLKRTPHPDSYVPAPVQL